VPDSCDLQWWECLADEAQSAFQQSAGHDGQPPDTVLVGAAAASISQQGVRSIIATHFLLVARWQQFLCASTARTGRKSGELGW